jgi:methylphosphotriester-DNA--protein-cysteine methyltransferase
MSITGTLVERTDIVFREAAAPLRGLVGCFWTMAAAEGARVRIVPDGSTTISLLVGDGRPSEWVLRGPLRQPDERRYATPVLGVGVRLRPGVAHLVTGTPAHAMVGRRVAFAAIPRPPAPCTPAHCIDVLEAFLVQRLADARLHPTVDAALREIERERGQVRIPELAERCRVSVRHLHRLMRTWVGFGPKGYASVIRFQHALHEMEDGRTGAALASETGYFDQAHLALDVARFANDTPGRLASTGVADFSKTRCDDLP